MDSENCQACSRVQLLSAEADRETTMSCAVSLAADYVRYFVKIWTA
jgi:hypothetical protein